MEKASKALRRSGVRIRSIGSGYSDLQMVISQLKDVRTASKVCGRWTRRPARVHHMGLPYPGIFCTSYYIFRDYLK